MDSEVRLPTSPWERRIDGLDSTRYFGRVERLKGLAVSRTALCRLRTRDAAIGRNFLAFRIRVAHAEWLLLSFSY